MTASLRATTTRAFLKPDALASLMPHAFNVLKHLLPAQSFWALGTILLAILALVAASHGDNVWRIIFFVTGVPALPGVFLPFYIPKSPLFLNKAGKSKEAREVLQRVARVNQSPNEIGVLQSERVERKSVPALFDSTVRRRTVCLLLAWVLISVAYYGVFVYLPIKMAGESFGFMRGQVFPVLLALVQLPGFALSAYGLEKWGRKPTLVGFLVLSALGCLLYRLGTNATVVVGSSLLLSFALLGTWGALYAFTPEVYPTNPRASGMGMARFGGLFAPMLIAPIMASYFTLSLVMLSAILLMGAACIWLVDIESRNRVLD